MKEPQASQHFGGLWTVEKLELVEKYLSAFTKALKNQPFNLVYIDAFAGTGYCEIKQKKSSPVRFFPELASPATQNFLEGSTKIALKTDPPFDQYIFIEKIKKNFQELQNLIEEFPLLKVSIHLENTGANAYIETLCNNYDWRNNRAVIFLDPFGMQVEWKTIKKIAKTKAIDLWFLFPLSAVNRLLKKNGNIDEKWKKRLNLVFGTNDWHNEFYKESKQIPLFGGNNTYNKTANFDSINNYILKRLKTVFAAVAPRSRVLYTEKNQPLFSLCFAVGNPNQRAKSLALKIAKSIIK